MKNEMIKAGYVVSPNNIHGLPGALMYAGGPGVPEFPKDCEVQVMGDRIRVFRSVFFGERYSRVSFWDQVTVAVFGDVESFLAAAPNVSEPGLPCYAQGWD